jgi:2-amino-4-hydroxy-6-hydroxymethyldihydropteridine diphosphokinase
MSSLVFISLGGNLGNTLEIFKNSYHEIEKKIGRIAVFSTIYQTAAWGKTDQADFLNQVIQAETDLNPEKIMSELLEIELFFGRRREQIWGPRILDLDILFIENLILSSEYLDIPHPQIAHRRFVLIPMVEIAPHFLHPVLQQTMSELLEQTTDLQSVRVMD